MSETGSALVPGARHAVPPEGVVATAWPRVRKTCNNIGWRFDPWQDATGRLILAKLASGKWAADLSILSIPRQVGKSYLLGCIIFALCLLQPKLRVIWTSHHTATTEEMYEAMKELAQHKRVAPYILRCTALQGSRWRITFRNGARIDFGARERGFGRGKARVGVLVLDEFQHISMRALSNLTPTTNTAENPLILCAGTPPSEHDNGEAFTMRRKAAVDGISKDTLYIEFSADADADLDDRRQWAKANPSFPKRTPERAFLLNRKVLDDESFRREFLGIHDEVTKGGVIPAASWRSAADPASTVVDRWALGVEVAPDLSWASVALAGLRADGSWHVALEACKETHGEGVEWLPGYVSDLVRLNPQIRGVVVDSTGPVKSLLEQRGTGQRQTLAFVGTKTKVNAIRVSDLGATCASLLSGLGADDVWHLGQKPLTTAALAAGKRALGDTGMWTWHRRAATSDITPIQAVTLALRGAQATKLIRPGGATSSGRRVVTG